MSGPIPSRDPDYLRHFQYTSLQDNSNKFWTIKAWDKGSHWIQQTEFARTGRAPQIRSKETTLRKIESLVARKERKGYRELDLVREGETVSYENPSTGDVNVDWLVEQLFGAADGYIRTYLNTTIDQLSARQVESGRGILRQIGVLNQRIRDAKYTSSTNDTRLVELAEAYYMAVPTQLPNWIDPRKVVESLLDDMHEQEERLDQLESAIKVHKVKKEDRGVMTILELLGAEVEHVPPDEEAFYEFMLLLRQESGQSLDRLYRVRIPDERNEFEVREAGIGNTKTLIHGTKASNVRHILPSGLIIPKHSANGSIFGRGIYFADNPRKSMQYTGGNLRCLFFADVCLGKPYQQRGSNYRLTAAPSGYDSVLGKTSYNEYIVYRAWQQTIKYLAIVRR